MIHKIKRKIKNLLKRFNKLLNPPLKDFDEKEIPWIDQKSVDIEYFLNSKKLDGTSEFDLKAKLEFWEKNGYVIFEQVIPIKTINQFLKGFEIFIENRKESESKVFIETQSYTKDRIQHAKNVSDEIIKGKHIKHLELHSLITSGKQLMLNKTIVDFLSIIFQDTIIGIQSLTFRYGSQQPAHQDFAYVKPGEPSHLAASWIPLENINKNAGPLFYYEGSHKIKKFYFGNGILHGVKGSKRTANEFSKYLVDECERLNLKKKELQIKKGDVLLWHSALVHGGVAIKEPELTRKSFVCHYTTQTTYSKYLEKNNLKKEMINGGIVYHHPIFIKEENYFN